MSSFIFDILNKIIDHSSPWTAYNMALSCKDLLRHYESGQCPHNPILDYGRPDKISGFFDQSTNQNCRTPSFETSSDDDDLPCHVPLDNLSPLSDRDPDDVQVKSYVYSNNGLTPVSDDDSEDSSETESAKAFEAEQKKREEEWMASRDAAGRYQPLGDLCLRAMTINTISGRDFTFICDNSDGPCSERQLLLIDDYYKIKKPEYYVSFVVGRKDNLTIFKAAFPDSKQYTPCMRQPKSRPWYYDITPCKTNRQIVLSDNGLFNGNNSEGVHMSSDCHRGYECIGFDLTAGEKSKSFQVKLELYDADHYVS